MLRWLWTFITGEHRNEPKESPLMASYRRKRILTELAHEDRADSEDDNDDGSGLTDEEKAGLVDWHLYGDGESEW
ncbi:MAG: hypothetical protein IT298_08415 [Chloroflexi bacterium]|jgi:hypothetical protein|nr:MAG: hypothetical protein UZ13_01365 [Chloroflexi bacterium OLB13]MBC6955897.1 hypothetical protein [Chloroflexota bacterium]MBV6436600.1 hypothetical protein [Anaerolineae bacterium]MDL1915425.1 hypothetical protein [Anaerolineae bacterium CFX4]OQY79623.1 MAG: hypothetical protein B6D42_14670 [Anaerolineae bacterium UTCFX5]